MSDRYIYFNVRARGELPRLICAAADMDFVDERLTHADWPGDYKARCPYGLTPVVVVDDKWYGERFAISLYFARKAGFYPESGSPLDFLKIDSILMFVEDVWEQIIRGFIDRHYNNKPETLPKYVDETLPGKLALLEKTLTENGTGYYYGNKLSLVDMVAFDAIEHVVDLKGLSHLDPYPQVKASFERVKDLDGVKKYIANRPTPIEGYDW